MGVEFKFVQSFFRLFSYQNLLAINDDEDVNIQISLKWKQLEIQFDQGF